MRRGGLHPSSVSPPLLQPCPLCKESRPIAKGAMAKGRETSHCGRMRAFPAKRQSMIWNFQQWLQTAPLQRTQTLRFNATHRIREHSLL